MTQLDPLVPLSRRDAWKLGLLMLLRVTLSVSLLTAAYYLIPAKGSGEDLPWLILELCVFGLVVGVQVPAILKAKNPNLRALDAMAVLIPLYLLLFARIYLSNSLSDPSAFTEALDNTTALYFTVTVFATVGFGDIFAQTNGMRLLVTLQMLLNLVLLGLVIRLVTAAARRGVARREHQIDLGDDGRRGTSHD